MLCSPWCPGGNKDSPTNSHVGQQSPTRPVGSGERHELALPNNDVGFTKGLVKIILTKLAYWVFFFIQVMILK